MGGGALEGGIVGGPGVGTEGPIGGEEVGPAGWIFGDVVQFDRTKVRWQDAGPAAENVTWA